MSTQDVMQQLRENMPLGILPLYKPNDDAGNVGLVIVDEVNGFCTAGCGYLAPPVEDSVINKMVELSAALAHTFDEKELPIFVFCDTHAPGVPEPPYPPHCERGSGEELLVEPLRFLEGSHSATIYRKDAINGFIAAAHEEGDDNVFVDWLWENDIKAIVVVGICTDICDLQFVQSVLSARNHGLLEPFFRDVVIYTEACATYDLPIEVVRQLGLPETAAHPREIAQHVGLWLMQGSGAILAASIEV